MSKVILLDVLVEGVGSKVAATVIIIMVCRGVDDIAQIVHPEGSVAVQLSGEHSTPDNWKVEQSRARSKEQNECDTCLYHK